MNTSTSDYSGACESGWTAYLDQFSSSDEDQCNRNMPVTVVDSRRKEVSVNQEEDEEDEDEDSSMLSDASSGPPHFHNQDEVSEQARYNSSISASEQKQGKNRKKGFKDRRSIPHNHVHLDDTASSPVRSISMNNAVPRKDKLLMEQDSGFSQGLSATNSKGKSGLKKHFGFLKSSSHQQKR